MMDLITAAQNVAGASLTGSADSARLFARGSRSGCESRVMSIGEIEMIEQEREYEEDVASIRGGGDAET
jgi:hypothetical protein